MQWLWCNPPGDSGRNCQQSIQFEYEWESSSEALFMRSHFPVKRKIATSRATFSRFIGRHAKLLRSKLRSDVSKNKRPLWNALLNWPTKL
jgi:hypothetical protein